MTHRYDYEAAEVIRALRSLLAATEPAAGHDRISELESLLRECNAVCLCGCPDGDHESDDCGESCGHDDHECIRVAPAVLEIVQRYRVALSKALGPEPAPALPEEVWEAAERVARLAEHQTNQHGTPFVTLWGQEGVDAMAALRRALAARKGGANG